MLTTQTTIPANITYIFRAKIDGHEYHYFSAEEQYRTAQSEARAHFGTWTKAGDYIPMNFVTGIYRKQIAK